MIKLMNLIELTVNNPNNLNVDMVYYYFCEFWDKFEGGSNGWNKYIKLCKPYLKKYNIMGKYIEHREDFGLLSKADLNILYSKMKQIENNG